MCRIQFQQITGMRLFSIVVLHMRWIHKKYPLFKVIRGQIQAMFRIDMHVFPIDTQTLALPYTVCEIIDLNVGLFRRYIEPSV